MEFCGADGWHILGNDYLNIKQTDKARLILVRLLYLRGAVYLVFALMLYVIPHD